ncbi:MAG: hypothetical protein EP341_03035 [Sphingomonadales bacterium]|nr:MAG: hypothetical protein EP341_03035 [Sphingomonadales bacterium]
MLEDVYRCVRDIKLFQVRAIALANALKNHQADGATAIGYEALSTDFFQIGKVMNNYLARVNKTIEEIPDADPEAFVPDDEPGPQYIENPETQERLADALNENSGLKAALQEALGKLEARKARVDEFPEELLDLVRENEPHAEALSRLRADYVQLTNRLVDTRLPALSNIERAYQNRLQKALYSERKGAVEITD